LEDYDEVSAGLSQPVMGDDVAEMEEELALLMEEERPKPAKIQNVHIRDPTEEALRQLDDIDMEGKDHPENESYSLSLSLSNSSG